MNSLSGFLSSPLLDFIPRNSPSKNIERPDEIGILLETLSKSDIQLLDRRVTDDLGDDEHQQNQGIIVANASNIRAITRAPEIPLTTPLQWTLLLQLQKLI